jgi:NAD(P) transhydrogenase subunit beta
MEHIATPSWAMLAYLISGVLFILALRGLSSPSTSQRGNRMGMTGHADCGGDHAGHAYADRG